MKEQSLHQIMNDMVRRLDDICPAEQLKCAPKTLSELDAFICIDYLLADLNKQYLEAKSYRQELVALHGADDAMAEVAIDMEDSAWCAMQTRYIELRRRRDLMERAQRMMRQADEEVEAEIQRDKERELKKFIQHSKILAQIKEQNRVPRIFEWAFLMLLFKMEPFHDRPNYTKQAFAA